jgi:hypothetical protein
VSVEKGIVTMNDSIQETQAHIRRVRELLYGVRVRLRKRADVHDASKLEEPEKSGFDEVTGALGGLAYGSPEYKVQLEKLKPVLDHHYAHNSHHPEHYGKWVCIICFKEFPREFNSHCDMCGNGHLVFEPRISGMSLLDLVEMFCDWKAATERHADGSIVKSIQVNKERFRISDQLVSVLENTRKEMGW